MLNLNVNAVIGYNSLVQILCVRWRIYVLHLVAKPVLFEIRMERFSRLLRQQTHSHPFHLDIFGEVVDDQMSLS